MTVMANRKILIIDDENFFVQPLRMYLTKNGFDCVVATDGLSGLKIAKEEKPDLIILDLMLPGNSGFEVCRLLKFDSRFRKIPVVIISAKDTDKDRMLGQKCGAELYLTKPLDPRMLIERINGLLT